MCSSRPPIILLVLLKTRMILCELIFPWFKASCLLKVQWEVSGLPRQRWRKSTVTSGRQGEGVLMYPCSPCSLKSGLSSSEVQCSKMQRCLCCRASSPRHHWMVRKATVRAKVKNSFCTRNNKNIISNLEKVTRKEDEECRQRWEMKAHYARFLLKNLAEGNCSCDHVLSCGAPCCRVFWGHLHFSISKNE